MSRKPLDPRGAPPRSGSPFAPLFAMAAIPAMQRRFMERLIEAINAPTELIEPPNWAAWRGGDASGASADNRRGKSVSDDEAKSLPRGRPIRSDALPLASWSEAEGEALKVDGEEVLRLLAEDMTVSRRSVEVGRLRVRRVTRERVEIVDEALESVAAEVERVPIDRIVSERPAIRETEDQIVVPIVEEILVVERRLLLKEELRIRKTRTVERHREEVVLRAHDAVVTRLPPKSPAGD